MDLILVERLLLEPPPAIRKGLAKLYYDSRRDVPKNPKVCFVRFENFKNINEIKRAFYEAGETLEQFFEDCGIGPFYSLPKPTCVGQCCSSMFGLGGVVYFLLLPFIIGIILSYFKRPIPKCPYNHYGHVKDALSENLSCFDGNVTFKMIGIVASLIYGIFLIEIMFFTNNTSFSKKMKRFSENDNVVPEEGVFFVIDNRFLKECLQKLEEISFNSCKYSQVEQNLL